MQSTPPANPASLAGPAPAEPAPGPGPAPRPLTAKARRRSWGEPRVRFWWLVAFGILLVLGLFGAEQIAVARKELWLVEHGLRVRARVDAVNETKRDGYKLSVVEHPLVSMTFTLPGGKPHQVQGYLTRREGFVEPNKPLEIVVDPADLNHWSDRVEPISLARELMLAFAFLPLVGAALLAAYVRRRQVLSVWRDGEAGEAVVVDVRHSAAAPRSRLLRCALLSSRDKQLIPVQVPARVADLRPRDVLWLVWPAGHPERAIAAVMYE